MSEKQPYIIIASGYEDDVAKNVCEKLKEGYILYGNITARDHRLFQAMILPELQSKIDLSKNISI